LLPDGKGNHIAAITLHWPPMAARLCQTSRGRLVQDPFYTKEKRRKSANMLAADAWLDSSLYEFWQSLGRAYTRFQDVMSIFHVSGVRRFVVELASDAFSFFAIGCVLMTALALPAFDATASGEFNQAE